MRVLTVTGPYRAEYKAVDIPPLEEEQILVRVRCTGICATDYSIYTGESSFVKDGLIRYPVRIGHEWAGVVEKVGQGVRSFGPGDRVYSDNGISCGKCEECRKGNYNKCRHIRSVGTINCWDGSYAEYMIIPEYNLHHLPDCLTFEEGALIEPASIAMDAFEGFPLTKEDTVAVTGTGAIGMCAAWLAKYLGAGRVVMVGRNDKKLETARLIGADEVINNVKESMTERLMELSDGKGIRQIVETTGAPEVLRESLKCIASRGRVSVAGFFEQDIDGIPMDRIVLKHQSLVGAAGCLGNAEKVCRIMQETPVSLLPLVTHKIPFEQCAYVFEHFSDYAREKIKIMVEFQ